MNEKPTTQASIVVAALLAAALSPCAAAEKLPLDRAAIVAGEAQPSYLQHAVAELADYLRYAGGAEVPVVAAAPADARTVIAIGPEAGQRIAGESLRLAGLGEEGYLLKTTRRDGGGRVVVAGATPRGTRAGIFALMRAIELGERLASVAAALDVRHVPAHAKRGLHLNGWRFRNPQRSWQLVQSLLS